MEQKNESISFLDLLELIVKSKEQLHNDIKQELKSKFQELQGKHIPTSSNAPQNVVDFCHHPDFFNITGFIINNFSFKYNHAYFNPEAFIDDAISLVLESRIKVNNSFSSIRFGTLPQKLKEFFLLPKLCLLARFSIPKDCEMKLSKVTEEGTFEYYFTYQGANGLFYQLNALILKNGHLYDKWYVRFKDKPVFYRLGNTVMTKEETDLRLKQIPSLPINALFPAIKEYIKMYHHQNTIGKLKSDEQIINFLKQLKELQVDENDVAKIPISNEIFYHQIKKGSTANEEQRIINELFFDHEILKYCDLSQIDFTHADIRGLDLSNTNAKINLFLLYKHDASYANLTNTTLISKAISSNPERGIPIIAKNTNFSGTGIEIHLPARVEGAIVDQSCTVYGENGIRVPSPSLRTKGIQYITSQEQTKKR